jgi:UDP-galactopyranose mutase
MEIDYLIVGAGLFGSVFAREATNRGFKCLVIDKRDHIAGNCFTEKKDNIDIHKYGPHIFHTNSKEIWDYVNQFTEFNSFINRPKVNYQNKIYSFPINLMTLNQLWGVKTPREALEKLRYVKVDIQNPKNLEEWILSQVGKQIYQTFIYGYTKKQWGMEPKELPSEIIKRLPIRFSFDDNYYFDKYQGIPVNGYTDLVEKMLDGIEVEINVDYFEKRDYFDSIARKVVYTGPIDRFFNYLHGELEYRSISFETEKLDIDDYQGNAVINYTSYDIPFTRIIEHKHFTPNKKIDCTYITKEFSQKWNKGVDPYYPINNDRNMSIFQKYKKLIDYRKYIFGGRLAEYRYYDMHQVIGSSLSTFKKQISGNHD